MLPNREAAAGNRRGRRGAEAARGAPRAQRADCRRARRDDRSARSLSDDRLRRARRRCGVRRWEREELAARLRELLNDSVKIEEISNKGRRRVIVGEYSYAAVLSDILRQLSDFNNFSCH